MAAGDFNDQDLIINSKRHRKNVQKRKLRSPTWPHSLVVTKRDLRRMD